MTYPSTPSNTANGLRDKPLWLRSGIVMAIIVAGLFVIEAIDVATSERLESNGIVPRQIGGLDGIVWAPLLHDDWSHLIANATIGVVLGYMLLLTRRFLVVTAIVWVVSGLGVWLFSPPYTVTVGASGVIFGWLTFLLVRGIFNREIWQCLLGVVLLVIYGSVLWGVLPTVGGAVSWQGHLFGAIGGVLAAWWLGSRDRKSAATPTY
ncbi:rhomboid family protein [Gordonia effusa NBRC 100432]|uniref:Rhomboid family protein n=1 Tax=Gordonia effusa NBRC 100432 TaxID=1077974 RepID=H0R6E8_9ACTN|nr:rhomboid family intramembrane serine protease [Gordonia effusa]GAB20649.1 rhomboid family protein [Gordonia effusa NBRC 100432]